MKPARKNVAQFGDLRIWQKARQLANDIYRDMRDGEGAKDLAFATNSNPQAFQS